MGYLLTKQAETNVQPADSEIAGNILGGLVAGGGLAGTGAIGNSLFKKKLLNDAAFEVAVKGDLAKLTQKLYASDKPVHKWLFKHMFKPIPGNPNLIRNTLLGHGATLASGFKNLKLPGKLKALGLVAAPLAAGGLVDAAVN